MDAEQKRARTLLYFERSSNRCFAKDGEDYVWIPVSDLIAEEREQYKLLNNETPSANPKINCGRLPCYTNDTIHDTLSHNLKRERDLLYGDIQMDMRRIEYENIVKRKVRQRRLRDEEAVFKEHSVLKNKLYYPTIYDKTIPIMPVAKTLETRSPSLTNRQQLIKWIYEHGNTWSMFYGMKRRNCEMLPDLQMKDTFLRENEADLCTSLSEGCHVDSTAFGLDEYGYYSLFPQKLLQDTLGRVHSYLRCDRYSHKREGTAAYAKLEIQKNSFFIHTLQYRIGGISIETYHRLQEYDPALREVIEGVNGNDVSLVSNTLPLHAAAICFDVEAKQWLLSVLDPALSVMVNKKEISSGDSPFPLEKSASIQLGVYTLFFSAACN